MNCSQCGTSLRKEARFCPACGTPASAKSPAWPAAGEARAPASRRASPVILAGGIVALAVVAALAVILVRRGGDDPAVEATESSALEEPVETSTVTEPEPREEVFLVDGGLADLPFEAAAAPTVSTLSEILGPPDFDTGEQEDNYCPGGDLYRAVRWGPLVVLLNFGSIIDDSRHDPYFWGWTYSNFTGYTGEGITDLPDTLGLTTPTGIGLGSSGADIESVADTWEAYEGDPVDFPPPSYSADGLYIVMDANGPQGRVNSLSAGGACGE